jgi:thiamine pyrophosphate-dependent acetolactate synthase large subunit-like protein
MVPALDELLQRLPKSSREELQITRRIVPVLPKDPIQTEFAMQEIARAVGVEVTRSSDIYQALQTALQRQGPTVIDIQIDPNAGDLY